MTLLERWVVRYLLAAASEAERAGRLPVDAMIAVYDLRALLSFEALRLAFEALRLASEALREPRRLVPLDP